MLIQYSKYITLVYSVTSQPYNIHGNDLKLASLTAER